MQAMVCTRLSDDLSGLALMDVPVPQAGPGEVLVKVEAAGINFPDVLMCQGRYQFRPDPPFIPGMELAGTIMTCGEGVAGFSPGDAVMGASRLGGFAHYAVLQADALRHRPATLSPSQAAVFQTAALTAWVSLVCRGDLQPGETLLVHGAAGGVGLAAVDLGLHLGATVIACGSTPEKRALLASRGAHHVLDPTHGFREAVKAITGGRGADVIYDPVGGDVFDESTRCIAFGGRLLVVGFASGRIATVASNIPLIKGFSVVGVRAGEYGRVYPERGRANLDVIADLAARGVLLPYIGAKVPLARAAEGLALLQGRAVLGKAVLVMD